MYNIRLGRSLSSNACDKILGIHDSSVGHGTVHSARGFRKLFSFVRVVNAYNIFLCNKNQRDAYSPPPIYFNKYALHVSNRLTIHHRDAIPP